VFPRYRAVVLVHGCFWHGHECRLFTVPATRTHFWSHKIASNVARDRRTEEALQRGGWRVLTVWECAVRGKERLDLETVLRTIEDFLSGHRRCAQIAGTCEANYPVVRSASARREKSLRGASSPRRSR
jgi:DNA mismatch endonuclease (patch repair protein)